MDEAVIRGLVMGGMLGIAGLIATLIWKTVRSVKASDEGSRRAKLVLMWGVALAYIAIAISAPEIAPAMVTIAVIAGVAYWVRQGMKK